MRICLLTGGGYPFRRDALGGWCRTLVDGLDAHRFELVTVGDRESASGPAYPLPEHVDSATAVTLPRESARREGRDEQATLAAVLLCQGLIDDTGDDLALGLDTLVKLTTTTEALVKLTATTEALVKLNATTEAPLKVSAVAEAPLSAVPLAELLSEAWRAGTGMRLSLRDARTAATLLRHAMRALAVPLPPSDLVHCVGGTTPLLTALAARRRTGTPLLLTEARAPVARLRAGEERLSPAVRTVLRRFRRAVARTGYAEAGLVAPLSDYHHAWALRHGAAPERLVPVPAGVDPQEFPAAPEARTPPAIVWAGGSGPESGLTCLLEAFAQILEALPKTVLHLFGDEHTARERLDRAVRVHPLPADPRHRYALGHLVVHLPGPSDPPSRLVEAMMSGRAVVGADTGPVAETLGDSGVCVPPDDPAALAAACIALLRAPARRRALGDAARRRALAHFTSDHVVRAYGALYQDLSAPPPAPTYELALAHTDLWRTP
ncbi:hypothetical protein GCM10010435_12110 [Winogradskya consettensis]|uniref:DUF3492 domain-containing protein n=1 Tax=Winogradskya consettensis TaxID=113560 RepID=A0A919VM46_9ACTN|nr:DUF3492 domain-containing protein [Actinoplanes consettensis]GIM68586.1 hypothetical protein Aco04nite_11370 [Actinoplanes consettensis]